MRNATRSTRQESAALRVMATAAILVVCGTGALTGPRAEGSPRPAQGPDAQGKTAPAPVPPRLVAGGRIVLENDLQASQDAMLLFREFRREFRRLDRFEEVDEDEEPAFRGVLTSDPEGILERDLVTRGLRFPAGYGTTKVMCLLVYTVEVRYLLWFDCEVWDTGRSTAGLNSHQKLVRALGAAVDAAAPGGANE